MDWRKHKTWEQMGLFLTPFFPFSKSTSVCAISIYIVKLFQYISTHPPIEENTARMAGVCINHNKNKIEYWKAPPLPPLTRVHFSATPSRIQFDSEQFPSLALNVFSTLTAYRGHFRCSAALPPLSCCLSNEKTCPQMWVFITESSTKPALF